MLHEQLYFNFDNADRQLRIYIAIVNIALILFLSCLSLQLAALASATVTLHLGIKIAYLWTTNMTMKWILEDRRDWLALQASLRPLAMLSVTYMQILPDPKLSLKNRFCIFFSVFWNVSCYACVSSLGKMKISSLKNIYLY